MKLPSLPRCQPECLSGRQCSWSASFRRISRTRNYWIRRQGGRRPYIASMAASAAQKALFSAIEKRAFDPAYHFAGDDDFRKQEALNLLVNAAVDAATRDFNYEARRGAEITGEELGSLLATPPMLAERRVIVVRDASALKKDGKLA